MVNESANGAPNARWTIAMARHADPDSADSQFFINVNDNVHLDATPGKPGYTVFGILIAGHEVAEDIELTDTGPRGRQDQRPLGVRRHTLDSTPQRRRIGVDCY